MYTVKRAQFITSAAGKNQFLGSEKPIIAVCGKSNVGKSSFINMLACRKKLAKVSKEPGRTRLINYFDFGDFILADLPGYGFARVSQEEKRRWGVLMEEYFSLCPPDHTFALVDIRHDPTADDIAMLDYLYYNRLAFTVVATKADKLSRAQQFKSVQNIATVLKCGKDDIFPASAETRQGLAEILSVIEKILKL